MLFFFSSRRRHTRYWRDWSSDVCSSDLELGADDRDRGPVALDVHVQVAVQVGDVQQLLEVVRGDVALGLELVDPGCLGRSEERRVGKECRSRWSPYH